MACLVAVPGASAASFTFAIGSEPDLEVDAAGTAHVVWVDRSPGVGAETVNYCQIPRGATACTNTQVLSTGSPGGTANRAPAGGRPGHRRPRHRRRGQRQQGSPVARQRRHVRADPERRDPQGPNSTSGPGSDGDVVYGPGDSISYVNGLSSVGTFFTNASLGGGVEQNFATLSTSQQSDATVGLFGGNPVVVTDNFQDIVWYAYDGSGNLNDVANWSASAGGRSRWCGQRG